MTDCCSSLCAAITPPEIDVKEKEYAKDLERTLEDSSNHSESSCSFVTYQKPIKSSSSIFQDRESIAKRFESCLNSGDSEILVEQLELMLENSTCDVESFRLQNLNDASSEELESSIKGKQAVLEYFAGYPRSIPDLIFLIHEWKIFDRPNKSSCLVFKFSLSGHQILQMSTRCQSEMVDLESGSDTEKAAAEVGKKRSRDTSVHFKDKGHAGGGRQDAKRARGRALGQYISNNAFQSHHRANLADVRKEVSLEGFAADDSEKYIIELAAKADPAATDSNDNNSSVMQESAIINMRGVMRLMLNESNLIYKVRCVHFTKVG